VVDAIVAACVGNCFISDTAISIRCAVRSSSLRGLDGGGHALGGVEQCSLFSTGVFVHQ
jgi:hypothetical protein